MVFQSAGQLKYVSPLLVNFSKQPLLGSREVSLGGVLSREVIFFVLIFEVYFENKSRYFTA